MNLSIRFGLRGCRECLIHNHPSDCQHWISVSVIKRSNAPVKTSSLGIHPATLRYPVGYNRLVVHYCDLDFIHNAALECIQHIFWSLDSSCILMYLLWLTREDWNMYWHRFSHHLLWCQSLGAFAKLRKATISFVMYVRPSALSSSVPTGRVLKKFDFEHF
jgi:hypothetical protein